ncbi:MAG: FHA domain-containing protein [Bryobacteraceae bacterium]|nr:FHA domain-containing protein [Bryobacteraceae bacterium]
MRFRLFVHPEKNGKAAETFELSLENGPVTLGRGPDSPVPLDDTLISRNHVSVSAQQGTLCVMDLSSNGVWVNGQPIQKMTPIVVSEQDEVRVPGYRLYLQALRPSPPPPPPPPLPVPAAQPARPTPPPPPPPQVPAERWWKPSALELWTLAAVALAFALLLLYRSA